MERYDIPLPTVKRFPSYLRILNQAVEKGTEFISATALAEELGLKPIQVRKDISSTGIEGKPKVGFSVKDLINTLHKVLGWDNANNAILIGTGNLGKALACYGGFEAYGLNIVGLFDVDENKIGDNVGNLTVKHTSELKSYIMDNGIMIAVITVPAAHAQSVANDLMSYGIKAIWNFAPCELKAEPGVAIQRTDLATSFAVLSVKIKKSVEDSFKF